MDNNIDMDKLTRKYKARPEFRLEQSETAKGMFDIKTVDVQDVLTYHEKKHRKDLNDMMKFMKGN